jgi:hypothetical protein
VTTTTGSGTGGSAAGSMPRSAAGSVPGSGPGSAAGNTIGDIRAGHSTYVRSRSDADISMESIDPPTEGARPSGPLLP